MTGNELRALREKAGLRQVDVAAKLGISYQSYQRYEKKGDEEVIVSPKFYGKLAELYNLIIDAFIPRSVNGSKVSNRFTATADRDATAISSGGDVTYSGTQCQEKKFTPKESQALVLKKSYDPSEILLSEYIEKLLKIKSIHEG